MSRAALWLIWMHLLCRRPEICLDVYEDIMLLSILRVSTVYGLFLHPEEKDRTQLCSCSWALYPTLPQPQGQGGLIYSTGWEKCLGQTCTPENSFASPKLWQGSCLLDAESTVTYQDLSVCPVHIQYINICVLSNSGIGSMMLWHRDKAQ